MTTKVKETARKTRGSRIKSEKVSANDLQTVTNSVSVSAPSGSGVGSGASGSSDSAPVVGVGSSAASSARAKRMDARTKLENSVIFEGFKLSCGVRDFSAKLGGFFAVPEWSGRSEYIAAQKGLLDKGIINQDQFDNSIKAADRAAGVSAPNVSAGRVLAVVRREGLIPEFVSLVGMSFDNVRKHIKDHGLNNYTFRLGVGAIRSNSDINDFLTVSPVALGSSASAVISALLSLSDFVDFNKRVSVARSSDISDYDQYIDLAVRLGKRLGYSEDRIVSDTKYRFNICSTTDYNQRKQLRKNLAAATIKINEYNDLILSLGGVTVLDDKDLTSKVARTIKKALKDRSRAYSDASTLEKLLEM